VIVDPVYRAVTVSLVDVDAAAFGEILFSQR